MNPLVEKILINLHYNSSTVFNVAQSCMNVWYPLEKRVDDLEELNNRLSVNGFKFEEVLIDDAHPELPSEIYQDSADTITATLPNLKSRLERSGVPRSPDIAMVICEDADNWEYIYQSLFMGQLMVTGEEKWQFYFAFKDQLPSYEDL
jgi:hypothetical protein